MFAHKSLIFVAISVFFITSCAHSHTTATASPIPTLATPAAQQYLATAFDYVQNNYVDRKSIDWPRLRFMTFSYAADLNARTPADTYDAITALLGDLGNRHTFFLPPQLAKNQLSTTQHGLGLVANAAGPSPVIATVYPGSPAAQAGLLPGDMIVSANGVASPSLDFEQESVVTLGIHRQPHAQSFTVTLHAGDYSTLLLPTSQRLPNGLGYLSVPTGGGTDTTTSLTYATTGQQAIEMSDSSPTCGWIVDLRFNLGGSFQPMLASVGPLVGAGTVGYFITPDRTTPWLYQNGQVITEGIVSLTITHPYVLKSPAPPVAVLINQYTGSAGEATLIAFEKRPQTRTFGDNTAGAPTGNTALQMSDGALLVVTGAYEADRTGHSYGTSAIHPDQYVTDDWTQVSIPDDPTVQAAENWLTQQSSCHH